MYGYTVHDGNMFTDLAGTELYYDEELDVFWDRLRGEGRNDDMYYMFGGAEYYDSVYMAAGDMFTSWGYSSGVYNMISDDPSHPNVYTYVFDDRNDWLM